jgi:anti-sigma B factor antagonist
MDIKVTEYKHCDLVKVSGRIDSLTAPKLTDEINKLMQNGHFKIVVDLSESQFLSSAGLRALISTQKNCKRYNRGEVIIASAPESILSVFELAGFTTIFKFFDNVTAAVGSF